MILDRLTEIDQQITLAINSLHSPVTDQIWLFFSHTQVWFPMYAIVLGCLFWRIGWKRALVATATLVLMVVCFDQTANLFKDGVQRLRPCNTQYMIDNGLYMLQQGGLYGFFSGHAANSFGFACCSYVLFRMDRRLRYRGYAAWIFSWAALVSISRVFVSMHYFGDILCGAVAGSIIGLALAFAARYVCLRWITTGSEPESSRHAESRLE